MTFNKYCLYRFVDYRVSTGMDEWGDSVGSKAAISLWQYPIVKETEKGVWIINDLENKFVNLTARKQFACATERQAAVSFIARKKRQIKILKAQLEHAEDSLRIGQELFQKKGFIND